MKKNIAYSLIFLFIALMQLSQAEGISDLDEFRSTTIENFKGDSFKISEILPSNHSAVVLYTKYKCFDCFPKLKQELDKIKEKDNAFKYIVLVEGSDGIINRKQTILTLSKVFNDSIIYFNSNEKVSGKDEETTSNGLFSRFEVKYTPALIEVNKNEVVYSDFFTLFPKENK